MSQFIPLSDYSPVEPEEMLARATQHYHQTRKRRTVRDFSGRPVDRAVIEQCLLTAGSAPSGANLQPWHFVAVSDPAVKQKIRVAAEQEEREFYSHVAPKDWLDALAHLALMRTNRSLKLHPGLLPSSRSRTGSMSKAK